MSSRRHFIKSSIAAAATVQIVPRHVIGGQGQTPPSEKLNIAGIGVGGKGRVDMQHLESQNIVALCDVDHKFAARTFNKYPKAEVFSDYRTMLDKRKDIDAVVIATPDHTHAVISMHAMKMGKHVYTQKPLTATIKEARMLREAAHKYKVATQMGNQGQSSEESKIEQELLMSGAIGNVSEVHVWTDRPSKGLFGEYWPQGIDRPKETPQKPDHINWDVWLGPAPVRPYHPAYHPFKWRGWWDFGTGALGDIGCHMLAVAHKALDISCPESVEATSSRVNKETYPLASMVTYRFPARGKHPPLKLVWYDGGLKPARPLGMDDGRKLKSTGTMYIGDKGAMLGHVIVPESLRKEVGKPLRMVERTNGHYNEWIDQCKGGKPGGSNFDIAGPMTETILLGNIALRTELRVKLEQTPLRWDHEKMEVVNIPEANRFVHREYRDGWSL